MKSCRAQPTQVFSMPSCFDFFSSALRMLELLNDLEIWSPTNPRLKFSCWKRNMRSYLPTAAVIHSCPAPQAWLIGLVYLMALKTAGVLWASQADVLPLWITCMRTWISSSGQDILPELSWWDMLEGELEWDAAVGISSCSQRLPGLLSSGSAYKHKGRCGSRRCLRLWIISGGWDILSSSPVPPTSCPIHWDEQMSWQSQAWNFLLSVGPNLKENYFLWFPRLFIKDMVLPALSFVVLLTLPESKDEGLGVELHP